MSAARLAALASVSDRLVRGPLASGELRAKDGLVSAKDAGATPPRANPDRPDRSDLAAHPHVSGDPALLASLARVCDLAAFFFGPGFRPGLRPLLGSLEG